MESSAASGVSRMYGASQSLTHLSRSFLLWGFSVSAGSVSLCIISSSRTGSEQLNNSNYQIMKTNQDYKNAALAALKGNWGPAVLATFAMVAISVVASLLCEMDSAVLALAGCAVTFLVSMPLSVGIYAAIRKLYTGGDTRLTGNMFGVAFGNWTHNLGGMLLMALYTFAWMLLLIIPGLIKAFAYAMTPFILNDKPELSANEAIDLSRKMMEGHKMDLFILELSFIGWYILGFLTFCVGYLWLIPYQYTSIAAFYEDVKAEYEAKQLIAA